MSNLIMSSQYVSNEMQVEVGRIPPVFLPVGNQFLLEHQLNILEKDEVFLTLPDTYELNERQIRILRNYNIQIKYLSDSYSIGRVLESVIGTEKLYNDLTILFGDTLVNLDETLNDTVYISNAEGSYKWSVYCRTKNQFSFNQDLKDGDEVLNGFVKLKQGKKFYRQLIECECDFISTINSMLIKNEIQISKSKDWFDFGHLNSYFESKKRFTTERAFNSMEVNGDFLRKKSADKKKIKSERLWFDRLPVEKKIYTPVVYSDINADAYYVEYLKNFTLSEIFCFCDIPDAKIATIIKKCFEFLDELHSLPNTSNIADWDILKHFDRRWSSLDKRIQLKFEDYLLSSGISIHTLRNDFQKLQHSFESRSVIHGDFCFSNIMYDFRSERVKVIDPRGCDFSGSFSLSGPSMYDYIKLAHSILGNYDDINIGRYDICVYNDVRQLKFSPSPSLEIAKEKFLRELNDRKVTLHVIYLGMVYLFLSMIPLHFDSEEKQLAFLINAIQLYKYQETL